MIFELLSSKEITFAAVLFHSDISRGSRSQLYDPS